MNNTRWDHRLSVAGTGKGLVGHAGAVLRKCADQTGLTGALGMALARAERSVAWDRGVVVVQLAVAIALGATSMRQITLLAHHAQVFGPPPSDSTVRRALEEASAPVMAARVARARAKVRAQVWKLIDATGTGFPWLAVAGKLLTGWIVIDIDATLITAHSAKQGAAAKKGFGFHPLAVWCANTQECLAMLLRPGNAGAGDVADHLKVLAEAIAQIPAQRRAKILVRVDGAGATHDLVDHLKGLNTARRTVRFTVGWTITDVDEDAIAALPADAWDSAVAQGGQAIEDEHAGVAELTGLDPRAKMWGVRLVVRRVRPSRRQQAKLTALEKRTGFKYSIICTNIGPRGMRRLPGSGHAQFIDVLHRDHAEVEDRVRTAKAIGLPNLPSKTWTVNLGWVLAACLATDIDAWTRLLGLHDNTELARAEPGTLRYCLWHLPARLVTHARRTLKISATWPWKDTFLTCWQRLCTLPAPT